MEKEKLLSELPFWNFLNMQEKKEIINQFIFTVEMDSLPLKKTYKIVKK